MLKKGFHFYINNFRGFSREVWILAIITFVNRAGTMVLPFLSKYLKENLPGIVITVDGGVNLGNAEKILEAGADRLTVGSGIWKNPDPISALEDFQSLV